MLKGVHVCRKLADGSERVHFYAWRGGPRIDAEPGTPAFSAAYAEAHKARKRPPIGTLFGLIAEFRQSSDFPKSEDSQRAYRGYLKRIEEKFGDMPLAIFDEAEDAKRARGDFKDWRDGMMATPRKADYAWTVLARVFSFGKDRGTHHLQSMRTWRQGSTKRTEPRSFGREAHIAHFLEQCVFRAFNGSCAGALDWPAAGRPPAAPHGSTSMAKRGSGYRQSKTGRRVTIPVGALLREKLPERRREGGRTQILTRTVAARRGHRAASAHRGERHASGAGIDDVTFHDIRGTAVTRLAIAGASVPADCSAITGHSLKDAEAILEAHYLGRDVTARRERHAQADAGRNGEQKCKPPCKRAATLLC